MKKYCLFWLLKSWKPFLLISLLTIIGIIGTTQQVIPLYEGLAPNGLPVVDIESFNKPEKGRPSVINVTNPTITVFTPKVQNSARPAVIICPGGSYDRLTIEDGGYDIAKALAEAGITATVLKYRTWRDSAYINFQNVPMLDLQKAMQLVKQNSGIWNIDTTKIGMVGFSAGGHLVAMAATAKQGNKPAFTILAYPVISFTDSLVSEMVRSRRVLLGEKVTEEEKIAYSPELKIIPLTPPAFIVHAADDSTSLVGNSLEYYKNLVLNGVPAHLQLYQKGGHDFGSYNKSYNESWMPTAIKWLTLNGFYKEDSKVATAPPFWNDIMAFKKQDAIQPPLANPILLVGSSSFTGWKDVQKSFPGYTILNRGFGGSSLVDVIRYAYNVIIPYKPKQVLIYCGENDLASSSGITAIEVVTRFKTLFGIIRQNLPNTIISFVSIKPSPVRASIQNKVIEANTEIKAFIKTQKQAQFIDIYTPMLDANGKMREELYVEDRLHMKPEGYAIWKKIITPFLLK